MNPANPLTYDQKRDLCERRVFLDGAPAKIVGAKEQFATIATTDGRRAVEFAWTTAARIVSRGGYFTT